MGANRCNVPEESGGAVFVLLGTTHVVGAGGRNLVAVSRVAAGGAIMTGIDVKTVSPTVVHVGEAFRAGSIGRGRRRGRWGVASRTIVVPAVVVVVVVVGTVVEAGLVLLH